MVDQISHRPAATGRGGISLSELSFDTGELSGSTLLLYVIFAKILRRGRPCSSIATMAVHDSQEREYYNSFFLEL